jgi:predicted DNA-binding transcriptional regulator YafY
MSRQLERLLQIDVLLRSGGRYTAESLGQALDRSERTIRSDLDFLRDRFDAPLVWSKSKGYHYTDPNWSLPTIPLSRGEVFALTLGARMLAAYAGSAYQEELRSAIEQLSKRLPNETLVDLQQVADSRVLFRPGAVVDLKPDIWQKLEFACQTCRQVEMVYFTATRNAQSERVFDPYILHFSRTNPYVTGFCHWRQAILDFRVDRIRSLKVLPESFEIAPSFNPQAHFSGAFQHELGGEPTAVAIWFDAVTAPYIRERQWQSNQEIDEHPCGSLTLHFVTRGLNEVRRWVLFYGRGAIVRQPPELVEMVKAEISGMSDQYLQGLES